MIELVVTLAVGLIVFFLLARLFSMLSWVDPVLGGLVLLLVVLLVVLAVLEAVEEYLSQTGR